MKSKIKFLSSMVIFGTIGVFVRYIDLSSSEIALLRGFVGSLFLLAVSLSLKQRISWKKLKENAFILLFSSIALGLNWIFLFEAFKFTTISNAALSYYFAPVFVLILSPVVLKERLSYKKITCIAFSLLGMLLIVGSSGNSVAGQNHLLGIGYGLAAAAFYASLILANKFIKGLTGLETTLIQLLMAALILAPYVFLTEGFGFFQITGRSILFILILGIFHTGMGFYLFFSGMKGLKGQSIASLSYIDPVTSVVISALILRESITAIQLLGGIMLLGSIYLSERTPSKEKSMTKEGIK